MFHQQGFFRLRVFNGPNLQETHHGASHFAGSRRRGLDGDLPDFCNLSWTGPVLKGATTSVSGGVLCQSIVLLKKNSWEWRTHFIFFVIFWGIEDGWTFLFETLVSCHGDIFCMGGFLDGMTELLGRNRQAQGSEVRRDSQAIFWLTQK